MFPQSCPPRRGGALEVGGLEGGFRVQVFASRVAFPDGTALCPVPVLPFLGVHELTLSPAHFVSLSQHLNSSLDGLERELLRPCSQAQCVQLGHCSPVAQHPPPPFSTSALCVSAPRMPTGVGCREEPYAETVLSLLSPCSAPGRGDAESWGTSQKRRAAEGRRELGPDTRQWSRPRRRVCQLPRAATAAEVHPLPALEAAAQTQVWTGRFLLRPLSSAFRWPSPSQVPLCESASESLLLGIPVRLGQGPACDLILPCSPSKIPPLSSQLCSEVLGVRT